MEASHLLKTLLDEGANGLAQRIVSKSGIDPKTLLLAVDGNLKKLPRVSGGNKVLGQTGINCLNRAMELKKVSRDVFCDLGERLSCIVTDIIIIFLIIIVISPVIIIVTVLFL